MPMSTTKGIDKLGERQYHIGVNIELLFLYHHCCQWAKISGSDSVIKMVYSHCADGRRSSV